MNPPLPRVFHDVEIDAFLNMFNKKPKRRGLINTKQSKSKNRARNKMAAASRKRNR